jgi:hypothetical protein
MYPRKQTFPSSRSQGSTVYSKYLFNFIISDDINKRKVKYILNANEDATSDTFFFKIKDDGKNHLIYMCIIIYIHVHVAWLSII